jgi:hypothetical protein
MPQHHAVWLPVFPSRHGRVWSRTQIRKQRRASALARTLFACICRRGPQDGAGGRPLAAYRRLSPHDSLSLRQHGINVDAYDVRRRKTATRHRPAPRTLAACAQWQADPRTVLEAGLDPTDGIYGDPHKFSPHFPELVSIIFIVILQRTRGGSLPRLYHGYISSSN